MRNRAKDQSHYQTWMDPNELIPYGKNAKQHDEKQVRNIANSIRRFGWQQEAVITADNVLVIGHGRRLAAIQLGCKMPVKIIDAKAEDLTDEDIRELRIADNKTNESPWDWALLEEDMDGLTFDGFEFDFEQPGTGAEEEREIREDDYTPVPPEEPNSKPGQIYQLGRHRLMCGDSMDAAQMEKLVNGASIDLLWTDPPYNVSVGDCERPNSANNGVHIMNDRMTEDVFIAFLSNVIRNADDHMKPGAAFYIFYAGLHHIEFETAIRNAQDLRIHEQLVWVKDHFVMGRHSDYQWQHEPCFYGWKNGAPRYFTESRAESTVIEDKAVKLSTLHKTDLIAMVEKMMGMTNSTVLRAEKPDSAELHPTVKPQTLVCPLVRNSSRPGENVLDPFGGSGSTLIACEQLGRNCYMMELDPKYIDVIIDRWEQFTGEKAVLIDE